MTAVAFGGRPISDSIVDRAVSIMVNTCTSFQSRHQFCVACLLVSVADVFRAQKLITLAIAIVASQSYVVFQRDFYRDRCLTTLWGLWFTRRLTCHNQTPNHISLDRGFGGMWSIFLSCVVVAFRVQLRTSISLRSSGSISGNPRDATPAEGWMWRGLIKCSAANGAFEVPGRTSQYAALTALMALVLWTDFFFLFGY